MMARIAAALAALAATVGAAQAQTASAFQWSGVYVGAHAGYFRGRVDYTERDIPGVPEFPRRATADGFVGGGLVGYGVQSGRWLFGAEADAGAGNLGVGANVGAPPGANSYSAFDVNWNAHLRARVGRAYGPMLFYVAGGLALAGVTLDDVDPGFGKDKATHVGWTIGAGFEHALTERLTLRVEYLRDDYGRRGYHITDVNPAPINYDADIDLTAHTARAALSFRF